MVLSVDKRRFGARLVLVMREETLKQAAAAVTTLIGAAPRFVRSWEAWPNPDRDNPERNDIDRVRGGFFRALLTQGFIEANDKKASGRAYRWVGSDALDTASAEDLESWLTGLLYPSRELTDLDEAERQTDLDEAERQVGAESLGMLLEAPSPAPALEPADDAAARGVSRLVDAVLVVADRVEASEKRMVAIESRLETMFGELIDQIAAAGPSVAPTIDLAPLAAQIGDGFTALRVAFAEIAKNSADRDALVARRLGELAKAVHENGAQALMGEVRDLVKSVTLTMERAREAYNVSSESMSMMSDYLKRWGDHADKISDTAVKLLQNSEKMMKAYSLAVNSPKETLSSILASSIRRPEEASPLGLNDLTEEDAPAKEKIDTTAFPRHLRRTLRKLER